MNNRFAFSPPSSATDAPREDWLRAGVLAGFLATFIMTAVLVAAYGAANAIGVAGGNAVQRWFWALVNNPIVDRTGERVALAIGANLAMGIVFALLYAYVVEPRLTGPSWWKGVRFSLIPWLLSLIVFFPLMGVGLFGVDIGAGPLPILGNLILHLVYGAILGAAYAQASEDWLDDTEADRGNAAAAERGAAAGVVIGLVAGLVVGWATAPAVALLDSRAIAAIAVAFIGAAIGLAIGSFAGMGREQGRHRPLPR
jgi:hypothetical protein